MTALIALDHQFIHRQGVQRGDIAGFRPVQQPGHPQRKFRRQLLAKCAQKASVIRQLVGCGIKIDLQPHHLISGRLPALH